MQVRLKALTGLVLSSLCATPALADPASEIADLVDRFDGIRNDKTPLGVTDGNPQSATAVMSDASYYHFGYRPIVGAGPYDANNPWSFGVNVKGGSIDTDTVSSNYLAADPAIAYRFNEDVALALVIPMEFRQTRNTDTYIGGIELGLPITMTPDQGNGWSWTLTPSIELAALGASLELAQGGYIFGAGLTSGLAWRQDQWTVYIANQITYHYGRPIGYDEDFNLRQSITQAIVKNGVNVEYAFADDWSADIGITYTCMLNRAFTDEYFTGTAGVRWWMNESASLRLGYIGDFGNDYRSDGVEVQFYVAF